MIARRALPWRPAVSVVAAAAFAGVLAACSTSASVGGAYASTSASASATPGAGASPSSASGATSTPSADPAATTESCVSRVFSGMTEAQRVGQLFLVGLAQDYVGPVTTAALK